MRNKKTDRNERVLRKLCNDVYGLEFAYDTLSRADLSCYLDSEIKHLNYYFRELNKKIRAICDYLEIDVDYREVEVKTTDKKMVATKRKKESNHSK